MVMDFQTIESILKQELNLLTIIRFQDFQTIESILKRVVAAGDEAGVEVFPDY